MDVAGAQPLEPPDAGDLPSPIPAPLARRPDPERPHLAVEITPLHPQCLGGARDVAALLGERLHDEVTLELVPRVLKPSRPLWLDWWRVWAHRSRGEKREIPRVAGL
jgi:hypothetical protein